MISLTEFDDLRDRAFQKMDAARKSGQVDEIIRYARIVQDIDAVIHSSQTTLARVSELLSSDKRTGGAPEEIDGPAQNSTALSRKARGTHRREGYARRLRSQGVHLGKMRGAKYQTSSGRIVGIGYASEVQPDKWFMGLPDEPYDILILLCETSSGELLDFILPTEFVGGIWRRFTVSAKQRKIHIQRHGDVYELEPKKGLGPINEYLSRIEILK
jgi:hypothetical protein